MAAINPGWGVQSSWCCHWDDAQASEALWGCAWDELQQSYGLGLAQWREPPLLPWMERDAPAPACMLGDSYRSVARPREVSTVPRVCGVQ